MHALSDRLNVRKLSFFSRWNGTITNLSDDDLIQREMFFGYLDNSGENVVSKAVAVLEEHQHFPLESRSMLWKIAEISVERQNQWIIFSRLQNDLSIPALRDFLIDSKNFLEHLRDENKRLNPERNRLDSI